MQKPNYYAVIPAEVRYNKKLTPNSKLLYAEITALCNMNGKCTASTQYFCRLYEVSRVSIQKWLKTLEDNGYIKRVNTYKPHSKQIEARVITLVNMPTKAKFTDNTNTNINNTNLTDSNKKARFKKPTLDQVKNYCILRKNNIDAEAYMDFYESKGWQIGKEIMKDWKAAVRTWERRDKLKPKTMSKLDAQISAWHEAKKLL
jgi:hypothetical protein|tara:strand:+ start:956 stop:1561 length:606 start_codon:yes stop_codon:yes gene_type:complete